jgi:murein DD-endopeptidase MepM/ murein hydrolase activator NlpD
MARRIALIGITLAVPTVVGLALTEWPAEAWHSGPIAVDLDIEAAARTPAATPVDMPTDMAVIKASMTTPDAADLAHEAEVRPATVSKTVTVSRGDTLMGLLVKAGIGRRDAYEAIEAMRDVFRPRDLKPGQDIHLSLVPAAKSDEDAGGPRLLAVGLQPDVERRVRVTRGADAGFVAEEIERPLVERTVGASGTIENNLSLAARRAGLPIAVLTEMIHIFSFDVDFQRELRAGDSFEVVYNALFEEAGGMAKPENVLYAALTLSGQRLELYRFTPKSGRTDFFDPKGQSVRKTLMRTPIDGARLSSGFGMRRHPILGYSKRHTGVDFAAPRGTPIYAAGDGRIETAGWHGGYGKYVRIRHNSTYKTAYGHMSRIAKGMHRGKRVKQGQVIGYVGTTGRSTGPHLHYEVLISGRPVNPLKVKLPSGEKLKSADLKAFTQRRAEIDALRDDALGSTLMVNAECKDAQPTDGALAPASGC